MADRRDFLTVKQAARELAITERAVQWRIKHGQLAARPLDPDAKRVTYLIPRDVLERALAAGLKGPQHNGGRRPKPRPEAGS